jgi:hypothetical protein
MTGYNVCNFETIFEYILHNNVRALIKRLEKAQAASAKQNEGSGKNPFSNLLIR